MNGLSRIVSSAVDAGYTVVALAVFFPARDWIPMLWTWATDRDDWWS